MVDYLYSTAQLKLRMRFSSEFGISLPSPELSHTVERNPEHPLFLCISFHQQLFLNEPTEMFLLQFPSLAHTLCQGLSSSLLWLAQERSACEEYWVLRKTRLKAASCGPDESNVCGSLVSMKHSKSSCSSRTRKAEPGLPRCSWSICPYRSHLKS